MGPRAPREQVSEGRGHFEAGGEEEFGPDVGLALDGALAQFTVGRDHLEDDRRLVAESSIEIGLSLRGRSPRSHAVESQILRARGLETVVVGAQGVDRVFGHLTVRRPLAAGDVHDAVVRVSDLVSAREVGGAFLHRLTRDGSEQWSQTGPEPRDVARREVR